MKDVLGPLLIWAVTMGGIIGLCFLCAHCAGKMIDQSKAEQKSLIPVYMTAARKWVGEDQSIIHCHPYGRCDIIPQSSRQPYSIRCQQDGSCLLED